MIEAPEQTAVAGPERRQILLDEYGEVCRSHAGITDFRAKLLALLPITSGAGAAVLVAHAADRSVSGTEAAALIVLGLFGAVVTFALFLYELRQIDTCKQLRNHAAWLESQLGIVAGQFGGRRNRLSLRDVYSSRRRQERDRVLSRAERAGLASSAPEGAGVFRAPFIGAEAAGYVVYHAVMAAWLLVAVFGIVKI